jgi:glucokinase
VVNKTSAKTIVLAGDMGGTKTDLALFAFKKDSFSIINKFQFKNIDFNSPGDVIEAFKEKCGNVDIRGATIGVAARIEDDETARFTNLDWTVDARELAGRFGLKRFTLINDLVATSWGLPMIPSDMFCSLQSPEQGNGKAKSGNAVVIGAGTGLGEVILNSTGDSAASGNPIFYPSATEGGHCDFAPNGPVQQGLLAYLSTRYSHVSVERVASGPGLKNIYDFLMDGRRASVTLEDRFRREDSSAVISQEAQSTDGFAICKEALDIFVSILGAEAGNLALKALPSAGVYIAGGIPQKILSALKEPKVGCSQGAFIRAFRNKGRFSDYLATISVQVVLEPKAALYGAANHAYSSLKGLPLSF